MISPVGRRWTGFGLSTSLTWEVITIVMVEPKARALTDCGEKRYELIEWRMKGRLTVSTLRTLRVLVG